MTVKQREKPVVLATKRTSRSIASVSCDTLCNEIVLSSIKRFYSQGVQLYIVFYLGTVVEMFLR